MDEEGDKSVWHNWLRFSQSLFSTPGVEEVDRTSRPPEDGGWRWEEEEIG